MERLKITPDEYEFILSAISSGQSVADACADLGYSRPNALWSFINSSPDGDELRHRYREARRMGADALFDEIHDIENRVIQGDVEAKTLTAVVASRKWRLSCVAPETYGAKVVDMQALRSGSQDTGVLDGLSLEALEKLASGLG